MVCVGHILLLVVYPTWDVLFFNSKTQAVIYCFKKYRLMVYSALKFDPLCALFCHGNYIYKDIYVPYFSFASINQGPIMALLHATSTSETYLICVTRADIVGSLNYSLCEINI